MLAAALAALVAVAATRGGPGAAGASSHREAPLISQDPTADNTDLYAFVSPDKPDTATIISNWIPGEDPAAGPNYYTFSPTARYDIYVDKNGDGKPDITYYFRFKNQPSQFFLGNTQQSYTVTKIAGKTSTIVGRGLLTPPDNIGPAFDARLPVARRKGHPHARRRHDRVRRRSATTRSSRTSARSSTSSRSASAPAPPAAGRTSCPATASMRSRCRSRSRNSTTARTTRLASGRRPTGSACASVSKGKALTQWVQVSRLGNPLVNEVVIPTNLKDKWNADIACKRKQFATYYENPILATVLQKLYPQFGPFQDSKRDDLVQVLLTGLKSPMKNYTGATRSDELRLNLSIPPTPFDKINRLGVLGNDLAGYPNGRRLEDDIVDISERAVGGVLIGHSLPLGDGVDGNDVANLHVFPYETVPFSGYDNTKGATYPGH